MVNNQKIFIKNWLPGIPPSASEVNKEAIDARIEAKISSGLSTYDSKDIGYSILGLTGSSNAQGWGNTYDVNLDTTHPRVFQYANTGTYNNKIIPATEPLAHIGGIRTGQIGFGLALAKELVECLPPNRKLLIMPCGVGGTSFFDNAWKVGGTRYIEFVNRCNAVISQYPNSKMLAIAHNHGGNDSGQLTTTEVETFMISMINGFRSQITGATKVPFLIGGFTDAGMSGDAFRTALSTIFANLHKKIVLSAFAPGTGLASNDATNDKLHFNADSQRIYALRIRDSYFAALLNTTLNSALPVAPTSITGTPTSTSVSMNWTQNDSSTTWEYGIKRTLDSTWSNTIINSKPINILSLIASTSYDFRVRAINANGNSSYVSSTFSTLAATTTPPAIPAAPTGITSTITTTTANVNWTQSDSFTTWEYGIKRAVDSTWSSVTVTSKPVPLTGLMASTAYDFRVRTINNTATSAFTTATFTTATNAPVFPVPAPAWRLTFDNNSFNDVSGNNITVTPNGSPVIAATFGGRTNVCTFDRVDDYFVVNRTLGISYTKSIWVYLSSVNYADANHYHLISSNAGATHAMVVREGILKIRNQALPYVIEDDTQLPKDIWVHIVITYNDTTKVMTYYKNGVQIKQGTAPANYPGGGTTNTWLGIFVPGDPTNSWSGYLDNPACWDIALTAQQVLDLHNFEK